MPRTGLEDATVVFESDTALHHVSLTAEPGEILVVLGPSGSGKSTFLRAVAGLVPLAGGDVYIDGRRVTSLPPHERHLAMVFEAAAVMPFLTVSGNLGWGLKAREVPDKEAQQRIETQARGLGLSRFLPRMPRTLSAGEFARVGIGRALVHRPTAFLLDEPLAHLDAAQRAKVRRRIVEVVRATEVSTFYVTHDQSEAMAVGDRIALLDAGRIIQVARPRDLYDRPASLFVAGFVGDPPMGLLRARPVGGDDSGGFQVGARVFPLWQPLPPELAAYTQRDVVLGIRAEDVHDARGDADPSAVTLPALVVQMERNGPDAVATLELSMPGVDDATHARVSARLPRDTGVRAGETLAVSIDARRAHVFDAATGIALWHPHP